MKYRTSMFPDETVRLGIDYLPIVMGDVVYIVIIINDWSKDFPYFKRKSWDIRYLLYKNIFFKGFKIHKIKYLRNVYV